ncbi:MAG: hypothetical protein ACD_76C00094G0038 [uncultured bacterium]|nr:MAG: hypothetical protein ACD_76C00094G0038 [uncultured bacterium]
MQELFFSFREEIMTVLLAAAPVSELRGAIPVALEVYNFSITKSFLLSAIGNFLPVPILIFALDSIVSVCSKRSEFCKKIFEKYLHRTEHKLRSSFDRYGALALAIFVAIPLPMTGVWTASMAAVFFGIKPRVAIIAITSGMLVAGIIVTLATVGAVSVFNIFV